MPRRRIPYKHIYPEKLMVCPECHGTGLYPGAAKSITTSTATTNHLRNMVTCRRCTGTGKVKRT